MVDELSIFFLLKKNQFKVDMNFAHVHTIYI